MYIYIYVQCVCILHLYNGAQSEIVARVLGLREGEVVPSISISISI